ncbi:MAG TPA: glycosyltransferase family 4 protein [Terriglobales bacterium]|nr:glycosyltransferase family 4 protein [Terriglobales bacterium]
MRPPRVLFLIENVSFLRDRRVRQEAAALRDAGIEVSVVCPRIKGEPPLPESRDGVRIYSYFQPWQGRGVASYCLEYFWALLCTFWMLLLLWVRPGFDVLHAANPPDLFFLLALPFKLLGSKYVYDQHDLCPEIFDVKFGRRAGLVRQLLILCERCSYRLADLIIVPNQSFRRVGMTRGRQQKEKFVTVRNGPDLSRFHGVPPQPGLKCGAQFLALYVGMMSEQDGVDRLVRSVSHIVHARGRRDVHFSLLGAGECLPALKRLAEELAVLPYISFRGYVGDRELLVYLSTADVGLAPDPPSPLNHLCTTIKVMEYMSCGRPIVSFDLLETRVSAGLAALYVSEDSPALFGDTILRLLDDAALCQRMGEYGRERVRRMLHWGRSRQHLLSAYARLLPWPKLISAMPEGERETMLPSRAA